MPLPARERSCFFQFARMMPRAAWELVPSNKCPSSCAITNPRMASALRPASADGKHLSFLRLAYSPQVYVAEVRDADGHLGQPHRLSLDELRNYPYDWTRKAKREGYTVSQRNRNATRVGHSFAGRASRCLLEERAELERMAS